MIDLLDHNCDVERPILATDSSGGVVDASWVVQFQDVACQAEALSAAAQAVFAQAGYLVTHEVFTLQAGILAGMRLNFHDGLYLRVRSIQPVRAQGSIDAFFRLSCEEVHVS